MTTEDKEKFEQGLAESGYKKIKQAKVEASDDYECYKAFYKDDPDAEYRLKYQIFFEFWDWTKYRKDGPPDFEWSVSLCIMPESCENDVGRRDLHISCDWVTNVDKVERVAAEYYDFITKMDKL